MLIVLKSELKVVVFLFFLMYTTSHYVYEALSLLYDGNVRLITVLIILLLGFK